MSTKGGAATNKEIRVRGVSLEGDDHVSQVHLHHHLEGGLGYRVA